MTDAARRVNNWICAISPRPGSATPDQPYQFGWRSIFYQLKAKFDVRPIVEEEVKATGWDRSDYA